MVTLEWKNDLDCNNVEGPGEEMCEEVVRLLWICRGVDYNGSSYNQLPR